MRDLHVPGLSLAVVRDGKVVKAKGYGLASLELNRPVTRETVFEIGSLTKQFTAAALLMLVEDGRVALDAPLAKYLPDTPPAWDGITVRHLLTHSSGIPDYLGVEGLPDLSRRGLTHREIAKVFFEKLSLEFAPGATWAYSNTGYLLLGNVIEAVSGQAYFDFLRGAHLRAARDARDAGEHARRRNPEPRFRLRMAERRLREPARAHGERVRRGRDRLDRGRYREVGCGALSRAASSRRPAGARCGRRIPSLSASRLSTTDSAGFWTPSMGAA